MKQNPIIVALDVPSAAEARAIVKSLEGSIDFYKIGLELFTAEGPEFVKELVAGGKKVFVDLKMYDIHETVKRAAARVAALGASLLTVHASAQAVRAAKEGAAGSQLKILAVTVLTSFDQGDLEDVGVAGRSVPEQVEWLAGKAVQAGADGLVCSPLEVARLRTLCGPEKILLVPGVRSAGAEKGDQKRVATPADAMRGGATYLVVGREITRAADPVSATTNIINDIDGLSAP
jgi:orotidine-5'-phosphate decarboxylase